MKKVFLDELPRNFRGILWNECVGIEVNFIYDDINGCVKILKYIKEGQYLSILYNNKEFKIKTGNFQKCALGKILFRYNPEFRYEIGYSYKTICVIDKFKITDKKNGNLKKYKYICKKCNYKGVKSESGITSKEGCPCCDGKVVVLGVNSIWDTDRWMCDLGVSEEDAKKYTKCSSKTIKVVCPDCGNIKDIKISKIFSRKTISCICGDGISYSEKFIYNLLLQLNVDFITQLSKTTFDWCDKYKYDFYLPDYNCIIESHGYQHYRGSSWGITLNEHQLNDETKKMLAKENGIEKYIIINCSVSDKNFISGEILNSKLSLIWDLSSINWDKCEEFALSNIIKDVCDYWLKKPHYENTSDVAQIFSINRCTVGRYLKIGNERGWCKYIAEEESLRSSRRKGKNGKMVEVFKDNLSLGLFISCWELARKSEELFGVKLNNSMVSAVCRGEIKKYKDYTFKYI